jgi:hypothetical protein
MVTTHDYRVPRWGHDFATIHVFADGKRITAQGWGRGVLVGDYLLLPNRNAETRYRVERIDYYPDPPDMWMAELVFAPREEHDAV